MLVSCGILPGEGSFVAVQHVRFRSTTAEDTNSTRAVCHLWPPFFQHGSIVIEKTQCYIIRRSSTTTPFRFPSLPNIPSLSQGHPAIPMFEARYPSTQSTKRPSMTVPGISDRRYMYAAHGHGDTTRKVYCAGQHCDNPTTLRNLNLTTTSLLTTRCTGPASFRKLV